MTTNERIQGIANEVISYYDYTNTTHFKECWKVHAACLAREILDIVKEEQ